MSVPCEASRATQVAMNPSCDILSSDVNTTVMYRPEEVRTGGGMLPQYL